MKKFLWKSAGRCMRVCLFSVLLLASAAAQPPSGGDWAKVWKTLGDMPVQSEGMVRSYETFCRNMLIGIADDTAYEGAGPVATVTWLLSDTKNLNEAAIVPVEHPKVAQVYETKNISLADMTQDAMREKLTAAVDRDASLMPSIERMERRMRLLMDLPTYLALVPREGEWLSPYERAAHSTPEGMAIAEAWEMLIAAVAHDEADGGLEAAEQLVAAIEQAAGEEVIAKVGLDALYTRMQPFASAAFFYILAAIFYGACLMLGRKRLAWAGLAFLGVGLLIHTFGIGLRWVISERPPLANAYETLVFTVACLVAVGMVIEWISRIRLAGLSTAVLGFIIVVLAHKAPIFHSDIRPLMPALQSSWLTYHVVTIMLSYACFLLAAVFACTYLIKDFIGKKGEVAVEEEKIPASLQALDMLQYRLVAVGFPLLTVGIILGAVWAERAWGRPWGFDPKETWSAITWMVYAGYLHVRFLRGWRGRGAAIVSLAGFACVLFTYFGVTYLLPSLHSYV